MRKLLAVLLALAMCVSLFGCGAAKPAETTAPATEAPVAETSAPAEDVVILYTNDVHTYIDGPMSYDVIAGLKASMKANVKTTKTLIKVYHMYMNQKIAILRAVMNNEPAKSLIRGTRAPAKVAAGAKAAGAAVASSKAGVAVSGAAKSAGEGLKSAGSAVSGAAKNAADGVKAAGNKIADGAKGAVDNVKGAGEKVRKHFTRK